MGIKKFNLIQWKLFWARKDLSYPTSSAIRLHGSDIGSGSVLPSEHCQKIIFGTVDVENISAKIWERDRDAGDDVDGHCKAASVYPALLWAQLCAKKFTFVISLNPDTDPLRWVLLFSLLQMRK